MGQETDKIFERAKLNLEEENHENALRLFNEVLNREPSHVEALRNKAMIKVLNANKNEAEDFLLFAIEQQPEDDQLYQILGTFYHNNNQPVKARKNLLKAFEINPSNILACRGLAMVFANYYGDHDKAITYFSEAIKLNDESADLYFYRGCSYMILGFGDKAKADLQKACELGHPKAENMLEKYFS
ncbi:MAG: hypothetical protein PVH63_10710 [Balneolaceae bacterium]|jgi:tetratricopeptide (TPR) repeat protein